MNTSGLYIGLSGLFSVKEPFVLIQQAKYEVVAIESINGLIARGTDPFETIYTTSNISIGDYMDFKS